MRWGILNRGVLNVVGKCVCISCLKLPETCQPLHYSNNPKKGTKNHQEFQLPKMAVLNLTRLFFWGVVFALHKPYPYILRGVRIPPF